MSEERCRHCTRPLRFNGANRDHCACEAELSSLRAQLAKAEAERDALRERIAVLSAEIDVLRTVAPVCSECDGDFSQANPPHDYGDVWCCSACVRGFDRAELYGVPDDDGKAGGS